MRTWWWIWLAIVFFLFVLPLAYGWAYRGWGPPYPTYYQRRRAGRRGSGAVPGAAPPAAGAGEPLPDGGDSRLLGEPPAWGWLGDLVWLAFVIAVIWFLVGL